MIINHNIFALNAYRNLTVTNNNMAKAMEKLSSGLRINRAADDAAGLAISEKMRGQIRGLNQAVRNAQDGISMIQTAEGALNETHAILQRMRELAAQAANDTLTPDDRTQIQKEINQLTEEIDRIGRTTEFNTQALLDGSFTGKKIQIGANPNQDLTVDINSMRAATVNTAAVAAGGLNVAQANGGVKVSGTVVTAATGSAAVNYIKLIKANGSAVTAYAISVMTNSAANAAIKIFQDAIDKVSTERSKLGAIQNRLEHTIANLSVASENLTAAESRIRDVDMAQEMMNFTRSQILSQAGTAMLAQSNQIPATVLQLLR
ncbi:flagellin and related hook-associated proteins [Moorella thermoacetica Y72]|uniref:Flagellin n=1 Tax=Moorella thermoacetica Y72 TaxID=1325331 RepID=A0A0S6UCL2_NEOTH|nr:flagellin [Moorella thermoacetica]GAF26469.1 flagellin and related hook-associated proteins [Moorella thermoacetica Y72]